jgi:MFS superfamily sulfate permease-like transporter
MSTKSFFKGNFQKYIPIIGWLPAYNLKLLSRDTIAGITLAAYAIPVSLAYATLAGLPKNLYSNYNTS